MARTRLFGKLRGIAQRVSWERRALRPEVDARQGVLTRRQLTIGAAQLAVAGSLAACAGEDSGKRPGNERVAVIGAGIAGLHCAYRLQQSGVNVTVFEASSRVGGRMFTVRDEEYDGQVFELGGELIDSNHATLFALADELGIDLDDRSDESIQPDVWFVNGAEVPEATIVEQFTAVAPSIVAAVEAADDPENETAFSELDETPLADWLAEHVPASDYPELNAILHSAYRGEFGLETEEQSALNMLYLIGADEPDPFRIFGESDERYHAREGSQAFPQALADALEPDTVRLRSKLVELRGGSERGFTLVIVDAKSGTKSEHNFDHVVVAIPFSVLRNVKLDVPLDPLKRQIIDELGYGTNAKIMGQFETRVWREEHAKSGAATTDLPLQQLWDSSIGQPGARGILTNFLGGRAGVDVGEGSEEDYYTGLLSDIERIFPGAAEAYRAGSARRMHWPSYEHTLGSYTCYRPGQWAFWELEGVREGNVHFCGEHTSADFQGWMEGGAETGALVASEILADLGRERSPELDALLAIKTVVPQPALRGHVARLLSYRERQRLIARASRAHRPRLRLRQ
jgi:monoamine oxidase